MLKRIRKWLYLILLGAIGVMHYFAVDKWATDNHVYRRLNFYTQATTAEMFLYHTPYAFAIIGCVALLIILVTLQ